MNRAEVTIEDPAKASGSVSDLAISSLSRGAGTSRSTSVSTCPFVKTRSRFTVCAASSEPRNRPSPPPNDRAVVLHVPDSR